MRKPTAKACIDRSHPKKDGKCAISIVVTFQGKRRVFPTNIALKSSDFDKLIRSERRKETDRMVYNQIKSFESKANEILSKMTVFTFEKFKDLYFENRASSDSIFVAFDKYIKTLEQEERVGNASSYKTAKNSLWGFNKNLRFADIDKLMLLKYEKWIIDKGNNKTTAGIYIRPIRALFNAEKIDKSIFPGIQGGPHMHTIAAKAVAFGEAMTPKYKIYAKQILKNAKAMEQVFHKNKGCY
jgi:hypothetical protein